MPGRSTTITGLTPAMLVLALASTVAASAPADPEVTIVGDTWYVATDGDDDGQGTSDDPFATWQRGVDAARRGDRVLIRPGGYEAGPQGLRIFRSGTREAPIRLEAANPADRPVLDCAGIERSVCVELDGAWWQVSDVEIIGTPQPTGDTPTAVLLDETRHATLDNVAVHHNHGVGIAIIDDARHNLLRNVDAYRNQDEATEPDPYENGDGIDLSNLAPSAVGNRVIGCRVWWNADDGLDLWESEVPVTIRRCWSWRNGYIAGTTEPAGNGQGFKLGRNFDGPRHVLERNLAWGNRSYGFDENGATGGMLMQHNTGFRNGGGQFGLYGGLPHVLRNNLAVPERNDIAGEVDDRFNSWTLPVTATKRDFRSVSWAGADAPRDADGSRPRLAFLRLRASSDLVDAGRDLGDPYFGAAPDLGAYERRR